MRKNEFNLDNHSYNSVCIIPKGNNEEIKKAWAHLSCALWSPDIYFQNFSAKTDIKYVDTILYDRFMEECNVCGKRGFGPTIKYNKEDCTFLCHPECGRINGYRLEIENINNKLLNFNLYCIIINLLNCLKYLRNHIKLKSKKLKILLII